LNDLPHVDDDYVFVDGRYLVALDEGENDAAGPVMASYNPMRRNIR
jgi:hypothetical protein